MIVCDKHKDAKLVIDTDMKKGKDQALTFIDQLFKQEKCEIKRIRIPIMGNLKNLTYFIQKDARILGVIIVILNNGKKVHGIVEMLVKIPEIRPVKKGEDI